MHEPKPKMNKLLPVLMLFVLNCVAACSDSSGLPSIPAQQWKDAIIRIETHPNPPLAGMSEIVVIVTGPRGRPVQDLTVSLRGKDSAPWVQAIQDGLIGVYRRAVDIGDDGAMQLQVRLRHGAEEKILFFPLNVQAS